MILHHFKKRRSNRTAVIQTVYRSQLIMKRSCPVKSFIPNTIIVKISAFFHVTFYIILNCLIIQKTSTLDHSIQCNTKWIVPLPIQHAFIEWTKIHIRHIGSPKRSPSIYFKRFLKRHHIFHIQNLIFCKWSCIKPRLFSTICQQNRTFQFQQTAFTLHMQSDSFTFICQSMISPT